MGPGGLRLDADGRTLLATDAPVVLRKLAVGEGELSCEAHSTEGARLRVQHVPEPRRIQVGGDVVAGEGGWIRLPPGRQRVRVERFPFF
jgi:hypothetical protein